MVYVAKGWTMDRLIYWKTKLKVAKAEERQRTKEYNQAARAWARAADKVMELEKRIEEINLARTQR